MKTLIVFGIAFSSLVAQAQDVIVFRNGTTQNAKVLEVGTNNVVYRKSENLEGPQYVTDKSEISVIEYANGSRDVMPYTSNNTMNTAPAPQSNPIYSTPAPAPVFSRPQVHVVVAPPLYYGHVARVGTCRPYVAPIAYHRNCRPNRHNRW